MKTKFYILFIPLFIFCSFYATSQTYVYQEEFDDSTGWTKGENETRHLYISNGKYYFEHKRDTESWYIATSKFNIDFTRDFEIETSITKISGTQNSGISFLYDFKDNKNYRELGVTASGYYRIAEMKDDSYSNIKSWTESSYVNQGNYGTNKLKIKKSGSRVIFYINGNYIQGVDYEKFMGSQMALKLYKNQKIGIDYFRIKYIGGSKTNTTNTTATKTILFEGFNNKNNSWSETNSSDNYASIQNGDYIIERKISSGGYAPTIEKYIDTKRNFRITAQIKKISGANNNGFGIVFGRKDTDNQNQFFISSDGSYIINKTVNGKRTYVKNWTSSSHIKTGNGAYNYLKVQKEGSKYKFYINSNLVYTSYSTKFYGDRVGFIVYDKIKFSVGYLSIAYEDNKKTTTTTTTSNSHVIKESILFDGYTSNKNNWSESNNENIALEIKDGDYFFDHKRASGGWSSTIKQYIDTSRDFKILADFKKISGIQNNGYGLVFGREDSNNQNLFYVNGNGSYTVSRIEGGKTNYIKDWVKSSAIRKGNGAYNVLKIIKVGNKLEYYINNTKVYTTEAINTNFTFLNSIFITHLKSRGKYPYMTKIS